MITSKPWLESGGAKSAISCGHEVKPWKRTATPRYGALAGKRIGLHASCTPSGRARISEVYSSHAARYAGGGDGGTDGGNEGGVDGGAHGGKDGGEGIDGGGVRNGVGSPLTLVTLIKWLLSLGTAPGGGVSGGGEAGDGEGGVGHIIDEIEGHTGLAIEGPLLASFVIVAGTTNNAMPTKRDRSVVILRTTLYVMQM